MSYILQFDGCCEPNPGDMGIGVVILNDHREKIIEISEKKGFGTNNQAEYNALIRGMEELSNTYTGDLLIQGDSQLVINQMTNKWKAKNRELIPLQKKVKELETKFQHIGYEWIKRDENKEADILSAQALGLDISPRDEKRIHLEVGRTYEFIFKDGDKDNIVYDYKYKKYGKRYYVKTAYKDGEKIQGSYIQTSSKKLIHILDFSKPFTNKKFRIIPSKPGNWTEYLVDEIEV